MTLPWAWQGASRVPQPRYPSQGEQDLVSQGVPAARDAARAQETPSGGVLCRHLAWSVSLLKCALWSLTMACLQPGPCLAGTTCYFQSQMLDISEHLRVAAALLTSSSEHTTLCHHEGSLQPPFVAGDLAMDVASQPSRKARLQLLWDQALEAIS